MKDLELMDEVKDIKLKDFPFINNVATYEIIIGENLKGYISSLFLFRNNIT